MNPYLIACICGLLTCVGYVIIQWVVTYAARQSAEIDYTNACTNKVLAEIKKMGDDDDDDTFTS